MHDLWHVLTDYGCDDTGEIANLWFSVGQFGNPGMAFIAVLRGGRRLSPRARRTGPATATAHTSGVGKRQASASRSRSKRCSPCRSTRRGGGSASSRLERPTPRALRRRLPARRAARRARGLRPGDTAALYWQGAKPVHWHPHGGRSCSTTCRGRRRMTCTSRRPRSSTVRWSSNRRPWGARRTLPRCTRRLGSCSRCRWRRACRTSRPKSRRGTPCSCSSRCSCWDRRAEVRRGSHRPAEYPCPHA